jgi:hypothetical protein
LNEDLFVSVALGDGLQNCSGFFAEWHVCHAKPRRNEIASARFGNVASIFAPVLNLT